MTHQEQTVHTYTIESALNEVGGFGRFQWLALIVMMITRNGGNYMYYAFAYLTMEQMYECKFGDSAGFESCSAEEDICPVLDGTDPLAKQDLEYRVDKSYDYYLNNWYV